MLFLLPSRQNLLFCCLLEESIVKLLNHKSLADIEISIRFVRTFSSSLPQEILRELIFHICDDIRYLLQPVADRIKLYFLRFPIFSV